MPDFGSIIHDIHIKDGMAFLSDFVRGSGGLIVLDLSDPDQPQTLSSLSIAEGRYNCFPYGQYAYCNQELGWLDAVADIRSDSGREAATGVYLYRLTIPTTTQTRRILLLR
jgi:hypothetical protein